MKKKDQGLWAEGRACAKIRRKKRLGLFTRKGPCGSAS